MEILLELLKEDMLANAGFIHRAFHPKNNFDFFADDDLSAIIGIDMDNISETICMFLVPQRSHF